MSVISIRDAPLGQICRLLLGPRSFPYPDEEEGFQFQSPEGEEAKAEPTPEQTPEEKEAGSLNGDVEKAEPVSALEGGYQIVSWYNENDPENPLNWSTGKKTLTYFQICLLTFSGKFIAEVGGP
jgi:DHA1 family multidrug resistance protein-like MFS transporter